MNPPITEMSQNGCSAQENLCIPEPDKENITVLSSELPNSPILPWHHYDSPWIAEDAESGEADADANAAEDGTTELDSTESTPASTVEAGEPASEDAGETTAENQNQDASATVPDVVVEPSQNDNPPTAEQPAVTLIIPPPDPEALLIDQPTNHHDSAA